VTSQHQHDRSFDEKHDEKHDQQHDQQHPAVRTDRGDLA